MSKRQKTHRKHIESSYQIGNEAEEGGGVRCQGSNPTFV